VNDVDDDSLEDGAMLRGIADRGDIGMMGREGEMAVPESNSSDGAPATTTATALQRRRQRRRRRPVGLEAWTLPLRRAGLGRLSESNTRRA